MHVRLSLKTQGSFEAGLSLRPRCADVDGSMRASELACVQGTATPSKHTVVIDRTLDPGGYWVVVDGYDPNQQGAFALEFARGP